MRVIGTIFLFCEAVCYSLLFLFLSPHHEFQDLLKHKTTENYGILNSITAFLQNDGLKTTAILILVLLALCVVLHTVIRKKTGRDDLIDVGTRAAFGAKGVACMLALPLGLFSILSDHLYDVETILSVVIIQLIVGILAWGVSQFLPNE